MNTVVCLDAIKQTKGNNLCHQMAAWPCASHLTSKERVLFLEELRSLSHGVPRLLAFLWLCAQAQVGHFT